MHRHTHTNAYIHTYTHTHLHMNTHSHIHTSIHPSIQTWVHPSIHPSIRPSMHPSIYPSILPSTTYIHTCIHTYIHTYLRTYVPTYLRTYIHTYIPTYLPTYLRTYVPTYLRTYVPTYLRTYIPTYLHTYIPTYIHTYIPTYIHTYIQTYIHTYIHTYIGEQHEWPIFPGEIGPMEPLIPEGFKLRGLKESEDCRMSREVGPVFCIGFRMRARKPQQLFPARFRGRQCPAGVLELVNGKDGVSSQPQLPGFQCIVAGQNCKVLRAPGFQGCRLRKLQGSRVLDYQSSGVPSTAKAASILLVQPPCSACKCFEESRSTEATSSGVLARGVWLEQRGENGMDIGANSQCHAGVS